MADDAPRIALFDCETDPFAAGASVAPFAWGFYDGQDYHEYWGDDCREKFVAFLGTVAERHTIYAHNGGRFDWLFFLKWIGAEATIISGRLVKATLAGHELRDSFSILPVALKATGNKLAFDYRKLRRSVRHRHRRAILAYQRQDCIAAYDAVAAFIGRFGHRLTMAGAAIAKLDEAQEAATGDKARVTLQRLPITAEGGRPWCDEFFRQFYYGGRVQCFEHGVLDDDWQIIDQNSAYPHAMRSAQHPTGRWYRRQRDIDDVTDFAVIDATSTGALPLRDERGRLMFPHARAEFRATGHEIRAALELGLLDIHRVLEAVTCPLRGDFAPFVDEFYALRLDADARGDTVAKLHYKLVLNSSYGRFALDPERLHEWLYVPADTGALAMRELCDAHDWRPAFVGDDVIALKRPAQDDEKRRAVRNVATGASITGATRAGLLHAIARCDRPIYCDTDSLICREFGGAMHPTELGAWKVEARGDVAAIAGKKLYAVWDGAGVVKQASKGARLTADQIMRVARGEIIRYVADAPSIDLAGRQSRLERDIRMTR